LFIIFKYLLAQNLTQEDVFGEELSDLSEDEDGVRRQKSHDDLNGTPVCLRYSYQWKTNIFFFHSMMMNMN
jgi:hypothetical protein